MTEEPKSKLLVDEDWKTQVQREKETLKNEASSPTAAPASTATDGPSAPQSTSAGVGQLPPATFPLLVTMLATQAMAALGLLRDPSMEAQQPEPELAKHMIDLLGMLEEKTKGNLSAEESSLLSQSLHELRMMYVELTKHLAHK